MQSYIIMDHYQQVTLYLDGLLFLLLGLLLLLGCQGSDGRLPPLLHTLHGDPDSVVVGAGHGRQEALQVHLLVRQQALQFTLLQDL